MKANKTSNKKSSSPPQEEDEDTDINQFVEECCVSNRGADMRAELSYYAYKSWMEQEDRVPRKIMDYYAYMKKNYETHKEADGMHYLGSRLKNVWIERAEAGLAEKRRQRASKKKETVSGKVVEKSIGKTVSHSPKESDGEPLSCICCDDYQAKTKSKLDSHMKKCIEKMRENEQALLDENENLKRQLEEAKARYAEMAAKCADASYLALSSAQKTIGLLEAKRKK